MRINYVIPLLLAEMNSAALAQESDATRRLLDRNAMFEPQVIDVAENVYTAVGYQVSANSMIVGDDGVIIIDPGNQIASAEQVRAAFDAITDKPVRAIIYTHGHADHVNGAPAFYEPSAGTQVWARSNFNSETAQTVAAGLQGGARPSNTSNATPRDGWC